ncbi:MAG: hypothetical protein VX438_17320, partial [Planctomycetota bacterium]|nr:hypothetical protein [Planctomycetota bacterium]
SFFLFYLGLTLVTWQRSELSTLFLLESSFWIIAVFFCLQPTQNPWYWTWAIPLLPFVRNRAWMIYSTFLFAYYLRFWFSTFPGEYHFLGFHYTGKGLFDYVFVWLEHAPVFAAVFSWHFFSVVISQKTKRDFTANRSIDDRPKTKSQRQ